MLRILYDQLGGIMRKLAGLAGAIVVAAAIGACSSSGSASSSLSASTTATPKSAETIKGTITGAPVASFMNSDVKTTLLFPALVFTGPVDTMTSGPASLGDSNPKTHLHTFVTRAGNLTIQRTVKTNGGQPTVTGKSGSTCYFAASATGSYTVIGSQSTGKFAGATGSGTYTLTLLIGSNLLHGKTTCSASSTGVAIANDASITFKASGPLTLTAGCGGHQQTTPTATAGGAKASPIASSSSGPGSLTGIWDGRCSGSRP